MPKKFIINEKQQKGRERKIETEVKKNQAKLEAKEKAEELNWNEGAKRISKKVVDEQTKRDEKLIQKKEREALLLKEIEEIGCCKPKALASPSAISISSPIISKNRSELFKDTQTYSASRIEDAIDMLDTISSPSSSVEADRHPERRIKAAYKQYVDRELASLKKEYPTLRLSQLGQMLWKRFQKSSENPLNKPHLTYETTQEDVQTFVKQIADLNLEKFRE